MSDKTTLEILLKIGSTIGITPPSTHTKWKLNHHNYYSIFLYIAWLVISLYSIYCNILQRLIQLTKLELALDIASSCSNIMQGTAIALSYLTQSKRCVSFIKKLHPNVYNKNGKKWYKLLVLGFVYCIWYLRIFSYWFTWLPILKLTVLKNYIFRMVFEYYGIFIAIYIVHVNSVLTKKFLYMSEVLKRSRFQINQLRYIQRFYRHLMDVMDDFNSIFGYQILFIIGHSAMETLECFQIVFLLRNIKAPWKKSVIAWSAMTCVISLVMVCLNQINLH